MRRTVLDSLKSQDLYAIRQAYAKRGEVANGVRERKSISKGLFYLENNFDEIDLSKKYSCAAEGHVSHVLSARLSSRPMGWSLKGAERIAKLRAYYFSNGKFSELALDRKTQRKINVQENSKYNHIAKKCNTVYNGVTTGHVVGLDGITNGLSVLLRSVLRSG